MRAHQEQSDNISIILFANRDIVHEISRFDDMKLIVREERLGKCDNVSVAFDSCDRNGGTGIERHREQAAPRGTANQACGLYEFASFHR